MLTISKYAHILFPSFAQMVTNMLPRGAGSGGQYLGAISNNSFSNRSSDTATRTPYSLP